MSRQTLGGQEHEKMVANKFGVATQGILVVTRTRLLKKKLCHDIIKACRNTIQEEAQRIGRNRKTRSYDRGSDKD